MDFKPFGKIVEFIELNNYPLEIEEYSKLPDLVLETINNVGKVIDCNQNSLRFINNIEHKIKSKNIIGEIFSKF